MKAKNFLKVNIKENADDWQVKIKTNGGYVTIVSMLAKVLETLLIDSAKKSPVTFKALSNVERQVLKNVVDEVIDNVLEKVNDKQK